jgi:hypothetical protein
MNHIRTCTIDHDIDGDDATVSVTIDGKSGVKVANPLRIVTNGGDTGVILREHGDEEYALIAARDRAADALENRIEALEFGTVHDDDDSDWEDE